MATRRPSYYDCQISEAIELLQTGRPAAAKWVLINLRDCLAGKPRPTDLPVEDAKLYAIR